MPAAAGSSRSLRLPLCGETKPTEVDRAPREMNERHSKRHNRINPTLSQRAVPRLRRKGLILMVLPVGIEPTTVPLPRERSAVPLQGLSMILVPS